MMRLVISAACVLALVSCRRDAAPMPDVFTETIGAWHRTSVGELPALAASGAVSPAVVERILTATYEGAGKLDARVYQLTSPAAALDVVQRWTPAPGTVFFYSGRFFVRIEWHTADRKALQEFVGILEKRFPAAPAGQ
jgi:hypothetical protein